MITFKQHGDFRKTDNFLKKMKKEDFTSILNRYGQEGVNALASATPVRTGKTAASWSYEIVKRNGGVSIIWKNSNINQGVNIAVILQYGHGTGWGGYVQGRDYINPAIRPIFGKIADSAWKEVTSA